jgi:hypothetical protein
MGVYNIVHQFATLKSLPEMFMCQAWKTSFETFRVTDETLGLPAISIPRAYTFSFNLLYRTRTTSSQTKFDV